MPLFIAVLIIAGFWPEVTCTPFWMRLKLLIGVVQKFPRAPSASQAYLSWNWRFSRKKSKKADASGPTA